MLFLGVLPSPSVIILVNLIEFCPCFSREQQQEEKGNGNNVRMRGGVTRGQRGSRGTRRNTLRTRGGSGKCRGRGRKVDIIEDYDFELSDMYVLRYINNL